MFARIRPFAVAVAALASLQVACAAPPLEEEGDDSAAAMAVATNLDDSEVAALVSGADLACSEPLDGATLCSHPKGLVILTQEGVALVRHEDDDVVTAAALSADRGEKRDIADVLGRVAGSDLDTRGLRPLGVEKVLTDPFLALLRSFAGKATTAAAKAGSEQAEAAVIRSPSAAKAFDDMAVQLAGGKVGRSARGAAILGGKGFDAVAANATNWLRATNRKALGITANHTQALFSDEAARAFVDGPLRAAQQSLAKGQRLAVVIDETDGYVTRPIIRALKERAPDVDVVVVTESIYAQERAFGVAFIDLIGSRESYQSMVRKVSDTLYAFDGAALVKVR